MYQVDEPIHVIAYVNVMILNYSFVTYFAPSILCAHSLLSYMIMSVWYKSNLAFVYLYVYSVASEVTSDA